MNRLMRWVVLLLGFGCAACGNHLAAVGSPAPAPPAVYQAGRAAESRVLVKTGSMRLEVAKVKEASAKVRAVVKKHRGYVGSFSSSSGSRASARLELRVPSSVLLPVMDELAGLGRVSSREVDVEDVTDEWIDLQAKLKNLRALRDRLRVLLREAKNVKETLDVEKELTRVQSELDALEGRLKVMQKHVAYSKLSVRIRKKSGLFLW